MQFFQNSHSENHESNYIQYLGIFSVDGNGKEAIESTVLHISSYGDPLSLGK